MPYIKQKNSRFKAHRHGGAYSNSTKRIKRSLMSTIIKGPELNPYTR